MRLRFLFGSLLCLALPVLGQAFTHRDIAFLGAAQVVAPTWVPSDLANLNAWWLLGGTNYATNGNMTSWADVGANHWHLTNWNANPALFAQKLTENALDSNPFLRTHGSYTVPYLVSDNYTNRATCETWLVLRRITDVANQYLMDARTAAPSRHYVMSSTANGNRVYQGGTAASCAVRPTNEWHVLTLIFSPGQALVWTNGAVATNTVSNVGSDAMSGVTFGTYRTLGSGGQDFDFAEIVDYSTTNSAADRALVFNYLTNKYKVIHTNLWGL